MRLEGSGSTSPGARDDPQLILVPSPSNADRDAPDCWKLPDEGPKWLGDYRARTLDPGESFGLTLEVWWDGQGECFPTGTFAFETGVSVSDPDELPKDLPAEGRWGFELSVQR